MEERRFRKNVMCVAVIEIGRRLNVSQFFLVYIVIVTRFLVSSGVYSTIDFT